MSDTSDATASAATGEREVAIFLREHPEFFVNNETLLAELTLPHPNTGNSVSLIERQVAVLRDQKGELAQRLQVLTQLAHSNEQLMLRVQQLILDLIDTTGLDGVLSTLEQALRGDFMADAVTIHVFSHRTDRAEFEAPDDPALEDFRKMMDQGEPVCGHLSATQKAYLFADLAEEVHSAAVIPLCEGGESACIGLVAIGSHDAERFNADMGTVFLAHLGAVAARVIKGHLAAHEEQ